MVEIEQVLPLGGILLRLAVILLLTMGAIIVSRLILKHLLWPMIKKTETKADDRILRLLESLLMLFIVLWGLKAIVKLFSESRFYAGLVDDFFFLLCWCIGVYFIFRLISIASNWYLSRVPLKDREEIDQRIIRTLQYIFFLVFGFLAIIVLLEHFGITGAVFTASLTALGIGGIIIGLAAQATLADIITGIVLLIDRPFRIGDRIRIEKLDTWGDVIEIGWRSTRILTRDNRLVVIPNSIIGVDLVTNYSIPGRMFRVETDVVVSYGPDIEYVRNLIIEAMKQETWIMHEQPIQALLLEFTGSGVRFKARCWIENYVETRVSEDRLNTAIYKALINANILMPSSDIIVHFADRDKELKISRQGKDTGDS
ncbi:Potassium efflux system KefA protein [Methanosarcina siciliae HI350]|uniref:Potassium efflux system KefA protein n=1 Tax=Methanosarcina siciliae HI350 TaxID=1434119 RepID=A0A0E3PF97_9EURY|nr:mechanosensitive ion channel family protein [Methanosarcina siciliae]AKB32885.1 Potassium efflux system KefA protein [Methanosarcina siciliae HI350]